jgi:hypothetical protein
MPIVRPPEINDRVGCLDDAAYGGGVAAEAFVLRELLRNSNALACRGGLMFRSLGNASNAVDEVARGGQQRSFAAPFWTYALPIEQWPAPKKSGINRMRARVRAEITSGRTVELFVASRRIPYANQPGGNILTMVGTGASAVYEKNDFVVDDGEGENLTFFQRAVVTKDDPLLVTATYGGTQTGTVTNAYTDYFLNTAGAAWNTTGNQVHVGGHYVNFMDPLNGQLIYGPCKIEEVYRETASLGRGLFFSPPLPPPAVLVGLAYEIRKLPDVRILSIAAYGVDRTG